MGSLSRALVVAGLAVSLAPAGAQSQPRSAGTRVLTYRSPAALKTLLGFGRKIKNEDYCRSC